MTGEITLSGLVLPVGGIKEKVLAAKRAGVEHVLLPSDNEPNVKEDLAGDVLSGIKPHFVKTIEEVLQLALEEPGAKSASSRASQKTSKLSVKLPGKLSDNAA